MSVLRMCCLGILPKASLSDPLFDASVTACVCVSSRVCVCIEPVLVFSSETTRTTRQVLVVVMMMVMVMAI